MLLGLPDKPASAVKDVEPATNGAAIEDFTNSLLFILLLLLGVNRK